MPSMQSYWSKAASATLRTLPVCHFIRLKLIIIFINDIKYIV